MGGAEDGVGERQARLQARPCDRCPRQPVAWILNRAWKVLANQADGVQRMGVGEEARRAGDIRLDPVGERVHAGRCTKQVREGGGQPRIGDRDIRDQDPADERRLDPARGIGDDRELRDVSAAPACRWDCDDRRDRCGDAVDPLIIEDAPAVRAEHSDALGGVDTAPAAHRDQHVAALLGVALEPGGDLMVFGVRREVMPDTAAKATLPKERDRAIGPPGLDDLGVGDNEHMAATDPPGGMPDLGEGTLAENDLRDDELRDPRGGLCPLGLGLARRLDPSSVGVKVKWQLHGPNTNQGQRQTHPQRAGEPSGASSAAVCPAREANARTSHAGGLAARSCAYQAVARLLLAGRGVSGQRAPAPQDLRPDRRRLGPFLAEPSNRDPWAPAPLPPSRRTRHGPILLASARQRRQPTAQTTKPAAATGCTAPKRFSATCGATSGARQGSDAMDTLLTTTAATRSARKY